MHLFEYEYEEGRLNKFNVDALVVVLCVMLGRFHERGMQTSDVISSGAGRGASNAKLSSATEHGVQN